MSYIISKAEVVYAVEQNLKSVVFEINEIEALIKRKTQRLVDLRHEYERASKLYYEETGTYTDIIPDSNRAQVGMELGTEEEKHG